MRIVFDLVSKPALSRKMEFALYAAKTSGAFSAKNMVLTTV